MVQHLTISSPNTLLNKPPAELIISYMTAGSIVSFNLTYNKKGILFIKLFL